MFLQYYGLIEQPFGVTPDTRFLYLGPKHREALASLIYGTEANRGFLALIAKPGTGKTSLLYQYLELLRDHARTVYIFRTDCDARELLRQILRDLGLSAEEENPHGALNQILLSEMRAGRRFVVVIDEAQDLSAEVLESVRLLSNFETQTRKLMQIVLAGQPQLAERLAQPSMTQLRQRISSVIRLDPFTAEEVGPYIDHRLRVAGYQGAALFTAGAVVLIAENSGGIPRNINNLCFNAMSLAFAMNKRQIDSKVVEEVVTDLAIEQLVPETAIPRLAASSITSGQVSAAAKFMLPVRKAWQTFNRVAPVAIMFGAVLLGVTAGSSWKRRAAHIPPSTGEAALSDGKAQSKNSSAAVREMSSSQPAGVPFDGRSTSDGALSVNDAKGNDPTTEITVEKNATLDQISLKVFGRSDRATIDLIRNLNPSISDPNHIEAGQRLLLPTYFRRASKPRTSAVAVPLGGP